MTSLSALLPTLGRFANLPSSASTTSSKTSQQRRIPSKLARHALAVGLLVLVILGEAALPSMAATFTVTDTSDNAADPNSLRYAVNNGANGDTINFRLTYPATITLTNGFLEIATKVTIKGPGAAELFISGNSASRVFQVDSTVTGPGATISGVTIEDGLFDFPGGGGIYNEGTLTVSNSIVSGNSTFGAGGGIYNAGTLTVASSTFSGNSDNYNGGGGGGIYSEGALTVSNSTFSGNFGYPYANAGNGGGIFSEGALTVSNSTFSGNSGSNGGAISSGGTLTVSNSTFSGNWAFNHGGGIYNGATLTVSFSTFSGNYASGFPNDGGGIFSEGVLTLKGTLLANESLDGNCAGTAASDGYNLSDDSTCTFLTAPGDQNDVATAGLSPSGLQDNGGPTETIALLPTSTAVNAIPVTPTNECTDAFGKRVKTDQRGVARPQGPGCDIGAYELAKAQVTASPTSVSFDSVKMCHTKKEVVTLHNNGSTKVQIGPISFVNVSGNSGDFSDIEYCNNGSLAPGKSCTIAVKLSPSEEASESATLNIVTNAPGGPIKVHITGAGVADGNCSE